MRRIRTFALAGLLLGFGLLLFAACGGGGGDKASSATATAKATKTAAARTTATPGATARPGETGTPVSGNDAGDPGGSSAQPTPSSNTPGFGGEAQRDARDGLRELSSELRTVRTEVNIIDRAVSSSSGGLHGFVPTAQAPATPVGSWFDRCCRVALRAGLSSVDRLDKKAAALQKVYVDAGHTEGKSHADQIVERLAALRSALQSVSGASDADAAKIPVENAKAAVTSLSDAITATSACCSIK